MTKITFDTPVAEQEFKNVAKKTGVTGEALISLYREIRRKEEIASDKNTNWDLIPYAKNLFDPPIDTFFQELILHYHGKTYLQNLNTTKQNAKQTKQNQKQQDTLNRQTQRNNLEQALIAFRDS